MVGAGVKIKQVGGMGGGNQCWQVGYLPLSTLESLTTLENPPTPVGCKRGYRWEDWIHVKVIIICYRYMLQF